MKIYLFNALHNGDLLFNQPVVKNLVRNNPNHSFTMFCFFNSSIFSEIANLSISHDMSLFSERTTELYFFIDNDTIAINLWIAPLAVYSSITQKSLPELECNVSEFVVALKNVLHHIQKEHSITIILDDYELQTYAPIIPKVDIHPFEKWYTHRPKTGKLILYYNYLPKSGQSIPVTDHDSLLFELSCVYPQHTFLVPNVSHALESRLQQHNLKNVLDCKRLFGCVESITCDNLCKLEYIAELCDYSIHFDIGACFYYINFSSNNSKNKIIHIGKSSYFYDKIYSQYSYLRDKMIYLQANHVSDVYLKLQDVL